MLLDSLDITFFGHACFRLQCRGQRLITDPYSPQIGYAPVAQSADVVTLSHDNPRYHSCLDDVRTGQVIRGLEHLGETLQSGPFRLSFIEVFENLPDDGPNAMTLVEVAGLRVLHMGDCGHLPTQAQTLACGRVHILLALAGDGPTLALPDLIEFSRAIGAKVVIPMHFGVPGLTMQIEPVETLEQLWPGEIKRGGSSCRVSPLDLPASPQLQILEPLRLRAKSLSQ